MTLNVDDFGATTDMLTSEGKRMSVQLTNTGPTSFTVSWNFPMTTEASAGALVLVSTSPFNPSNVPTDTVKYSPSLDLSAPNDTIGFNGQAQVVGAFYGNMTTLSINLINANPTVIYYAMVYSVSNVIQYSKGGALSYPLAIGRNQSNSSNITGNIPRSDSPPINPFIGQIYFNKATNTVFMWTGAIWMTAGTEPVSGLQTTPGITDSAFSTGDDSIGTSPRGGNTVVTGHSFPANPNPGDFFYNLNTEILNVWNGTAWIPANTSQQGVPMYAKDAVGTDGTPDERAELVNILMHQMGYPKICVELNDTHFDMAIDRALDEFRRRADNAYVKMYTLFNLLEGQQIYYLNDPTLGTDRTVDVIKVHRLSALGAYTSNDSGVYTQVFLNQVYSPSPVDMTSIHLLANLSKELERIFAGNFMFTWHEAQRILNIQRKIYRNEVVILECVQERTEQDLITDRWTKPWIQDWAHAKLLETLGYIRSKFGSLPGASGGLTLNGNELLSRADQKFEALKLQLDNYEVGNNSPEFAAPLLIG